jgi:hypothetical protein
MRTAYFTLLIVLATFVGCKSGSGPDTLNREDSIEQSEVYTLVKNRNFSIRADWAMPMQGDRFVIAEIPNGFSIQGDTAEARLPFYGVRQMGFNFNETGIIFNGPMEEEKLKIDASRNAIKYNFTVEEDDEVFDVLLTIFGNKTTYIDINSNQRDSMSYQGEIEPLNNYKN